MPVLSDLLGKSFVFTRAYTPNPESSPARASLFTGLDPCVHGLWTNGVTLPAIEQTFVRTLAQAGYANYLAGRYQLSGVSQWTTEAIRPGEFIQADWAHGPLHRSRQNAYLVWLQNEAPDRYSVIFETQANPGDTKATQQQVAALQALPDALSFNHWVGERTAGWIKDQPANQPFLAIAGLSVGQHYGAESPEGSDSETVDKTALSQADAAIEQIRDQIDQSQLTDDTVLIIVAARGNANAGENNYSLHEDEIRVPVVIHSPGQAGQVFDSIVSTIDLAPTILKLANVFSPRRLQGTSILNADSADIIHRAWNLSRLRRNRVDGQNDWQTALCVDDMKLVVSHDTGGKPGNSNNENISLYKLDTDPLEQNNLANDEAYAPELEHLIDQMIDARCALEDRTEPRVAEF